MSPTIKVYCLVVADAVDAALAEVAGTGRGQLFLKKSPARGHTTAEAANEKTGGGESAITQRGARHLSHRHW